LDLVARSLWIRGLSALALFGGVFWWTGSLAVSLAAWAGAWVLSIVFFDLPCLRRLLRQADAGTLKPRWNRKKVKDIVWLTLPLGLVMLLINLRNTIPRTFLESACGEDQLGIFAALSYLVIAGSTVILALSQSSIARLARYYAEGSRELFRTTILKTILVGVVVGIGGVLVAVVAGGPLLTLLYSPEYAEHNGLFVLIMVAGGVTFVGSLMGSPAMAMRLYRKMLWIYLVNAVVLVLLAWILIPRHGMTGAAWAMLGGAIWVAIGNGTLIYRGISRMDSPDSLVDRSVRG
jgi:O-antigen/teichoic acid export membrane protein